MTTTVKVEAHCPEYIEVIVLTSISGKTLNTVVLQDGDTGTFHAYDNQVVTVREHKKKR
jgi:hypothetical protein